MTNPFALADWQAPRPPLSPHQKRRRHVAAVSTIVTVICAALVAAVLGTLASHPGPLPAPRLSAHDPVPADRVHWFAPPNCGISAATAHALVPHAQLDRAGVEGICTWQEDYDFGEKANEDRTLEVSIRLHHGGPGTPDNTDAVRDLTGGTASAGSDHSPVAGAMVEWGPDLVMRYRGQDQVVSTVNGLGDEATHEESTDDDHAEAYVSFRADNATVSVDYTARPSLEIRRHAPKKPPVPARQLRPGALRVAAEVARAMGVPAAPKVTAPPRTRRAQVRTPSSLCVAVPSELRDRLVDDDGPAAGGPKYCEVSGPERDVNVGIAPYSTPAAAGRDYLITYLDTRATPPAGRRDARYFHALAGLGDQAFCEYHSANTAVGDAQPGPPRPDRALARVVVRVGAALVTVWYGDQRAVEDPLTKEEAVNGAYAVAVRAVRVVRG